MTEKSTKQLVVGWPKQKGPMPIHHCPGCHYGTVIRIIAEVLDELGVADRAIGTGGPSCSGRFNVHLDIDSITSAHGRGPAVATAIKRIRPNALVFTYQGDGDLAGIGAGHFINAMTRAEKITTLFMNNAIFGLTGGQWAPTSLVGMNTTTTPGGRNPATMGYPFHGAELSAMMKGTAFSARVSVHTPANRQKAKKALTQAFKKQIDGVGYSFVEFLSACPTNWKLSPVDCLAYIENKMIAEFPLGVFKDVDKLD